MILNFLLEKVSFVSCLKLTDRDVETVKMLHVLPKRSYTE